MKDSLVVAATSAPRAARPAPSLLEPASARVGAEAHEREGAIVRVDDELREALVFAFATGHAGDALDRAVEQTTLGPTTWNAEDFAEDVYLGELIERCLPVVALGKKLPRSGSLMRRILSAPPASPATARYRQETFEELVREPALREHAERLLVHVTTLRALLAKPGGLRLDVFERRLSILRAVRDVVDLARTGFTAAASALREIDAWGGALSAEPAYLKLMDLLAYEECTTELDVRLRLGVDGKIRDFEVLGRRRPLASPVHRNAALRFFTKLGLFVRGERFDDHELLARLIDEVFERLVVHLVPLFGLAAGLEFYVSGLAFRDRAMRAGLPVTLGSFASDPPPGAAPVARGHELLRLWNPLLLADEARIVTSDLAIERPGARVVVTGPNSGGKTRLLQAIALSQILAQAGMFVPAERACIPWASGLFVSLIDHQRPGAAPLGGASASEGRLGTELLRIRRLFESLRGGSLVILDELCSGTNPDEGEEIFRLVVRLLAELHPAAFITTHFLRFASRLAAEAASAGEGDASFGLDFLRAELDAAENPTFRFVPGVAVTSLAHRTAVRLGVTEEGLRRAIRLRNPTS